MEVTPAEAASHGKGVTCAASQQCSAKFRFKGQPGQYEIDVQYFDPNDGASSFSMKVDGRKVDEWLADNDLPTKKIDADSSTRRMIPGITLKSGDEIEIDGTPAGADQAALDY